MGVYVTTFKTKEDVFEALNILDFELFQTYGELEKKIKFIIFGATALLLHTNFRGTKDIDVYFEERVDRKAAEIMDKHSVNNRLEQLMNVPLPEDFIDRSILISEGSCIQVKLASKEDLVLSKLFTTRGKNSDEEDLIKSSILDDVDWTYIQDIYDEFAGSRVGTSVNMTTLDDIIKRRKEFISQKKE